MEKKLAIVNISLPIALFTLLQFVDYSENLTYIIIMTLFVGWLLPYLNPIITGLTILNNSHRKLSLIFNIITVILCIILIGLIIYIYDSNFIYMLIEYILLCILSIINIINQIIYLKRHPHVNIENLTIQKIKAENNGIIK